jgi:hypothetical protein
MERYLDMKYAYHPIYIPMYETNIELWLQKLEQRRIEGMDLWDYQLERDCAALFEFDSMLPKEVHDECKGDQ